MSDSQDQPWSNNTNAPKIPRYLYLQEKANFAGYIIGAILYGVLIVLFFRCMATLVDPVHRRMEGIKWGLVAYTVAAFSFATVFTSMNLNVQSVSYIDNREYPGVNGFLPGPLGYQLIIGTNVISVIPTIAFLLNFWLADGFLLYRCYVVYAQKFWAIAFPCLMYLASLGVGMTLLVYQALGLGTFWAPFSVGLLVPYLAISVSLNVLLTLMIVVRLILYSRNIRSAMGFGGVGGLYKTIITILIESSALYAVSSLLVVGQSNYAMMDIFLPILAENQVIAPLLIIQRVANRSALTNGTIVTGHTGSLNFRNPGETTGGNSALPDEPATRSPVNKYGDSSGELGVVVETTVDLRREGSSIELHEKSSSTKPT